MEKLRGAVCRKNESNFEQNVRLHSDLENVNKGTTTGFRASDCVRQTKDFE